MHLKEYQPKKALPEIGMFHRPGFPQVLNLLDEVAPQFCVTHALYRGIFVTFAFLKRSPVLQLLNRRTLLHRNILYFHQSTARSKFLSKFLGIELLHFLKIQRTFAFPNMFHKKWRRRQLPKTPCLRTCRTSGTSGYECSPPFVCRSAQGRMQDLLVC